MTQQEKQINKVAKAYLIYQLLDEHLMEIDLPFIRAIKKEYKANIDYLKLKIRVKDTLRLLKPLSKIDLFSNDVDMTQSALGAKELLIDTLVNGSLEYNADLANYLNNYNK